jgi:ribonuclease HIII
MGGRIKRLSFLSIPARLGRAVNITFPLGTALHKIVQAATDLEETNLFFLNDNDLSQIVIVSTIKV